MHNPEDLAAGVSTAQQALPANTGDSKSSEIKVFEQADTLSSSPTSLRNMETLKGRAGHMIVDYGFVKVRGGQVEARGRSGTGQGARERGRVNPYLV